MCVCHRHIQTLPFDINISQTYLHGAKINIFATDTNNYISWIRYWKHNVHTHTLIPIHSILDLMKGFIGTYTSTQSSSIRCLLAMTLAHHSLQKYRYIVIVKVNFGRSTIFVYKWWANFVLLYRIGLWILVSDTCIEMGWYIIHASILWKFRLPRRNCHAFDSGLLSRKVSHYWLYTPMVFLTELLIAKHFLVENPTIT